MPRAVPLLLRAAAGHILFDAAYSEVIKEYMELQGYETVSFEKGSHDVYEKAPIYNFEMHTSLYNSAHQEGWEDYYKDVKKRLHLNAGSSYGYHSPCGIRSTQARPSR